MATTTSSTACASSVVNSKDDVSTRQLRTGPRAPRRTSLRKGLFNILTNTFDFTQLRVLDLFGGTGNHSYEFISRGCTDVTYVDKFPGCVNFVRKTAQTLGITDELQIVRADVFRFVAQPQAPYDYIFAGPPYPLPNIPDIPDLIFRYQLIKPEGWFVLEHNPQHDFQQHPHFLQARNYGTTIFSIFSPTLQRDA